MFVIVIVLEFDAVSMTRAFVLAFRGAREHTATVVHVRLRGGI